MHIDVEEEISLEEYTILELYVKESDQRQEKQLSELRESMSQSQNENRVWQRIPKVNERIKFHLPKIHTKVINRGGKSTGRNKYYVNVINDKQKLWVHMDKLEYEVIKKDATKDIKNGIEENNGNRL